MGEGETLDLFHKNITHVLNEKMLNNDDIAE